MFPFPSPRSKVVEALGDFQAGWAVVPDVRTTDITTRTMLVNQTRIEPGPTIGTLAVTFEVTLVLPNQDQTFAEDQFDLAVTELITTLTRVPWVAWTAASKGLYDNTYLAWTFDLTVHTTVSEE